MGAREAGAAVIVRVDLATAIVLYLLGSLLVVLAAWIWHELRHRHAPLEIERKTALECPICLHTFIASTEMPSERCPRCNSWVKIAAKN